ncbi:hypothetical protein EJB05_50309, partial [Eragrostis curvula]
MNPCFCTQVTGAAWGSSSVVANELAIVSDIRLSLEETHLQAESEEEAIDADNTTVGGSTNVDSIESEEGAHDYQEDFSTAQEPYVGHLFDSKQEARHMYNAYAMRKGFSVRTNTSRRSTVTTELRKQQFVCNKESFGRKPKTIQQQINDIDVAIAQQNSEEEANLPNIIIGKKRKREKMKYTNCQAMMVITFNGARWEVTQFISDHNHALVNKLSLAKFLRSHAGIPEDEVRFLTILHTCNLETSRMMQLMAELYGSAHHVPYTAKHVGNLRSSIRSEMAANDMAETIDYFYKLQKEDPNFFFMFKLDSFGKLENLIWADAAARQAYETYNDCISFDSTYLTNKYRMPFAPFIPIHRHGQSIQVGCGFIRNESAKSYEWLFKTLLQAMGGKELAHIITDQDLSMAAAIKSVFLTTIHRCCGWHILSKRKAQLGRIFCTKKGMENEFYDIINHSLNPEEFQARWNEMISKFDVLGNQTLSELFEIRKLWVPAYYMDCFFPFLQSTHRSEGFNAVLKKYVNPKKNSMFDFTHQYERIREKTDVAENGQDYLTDQKEPALWSRYPIEHHAMDVYTRRIYWVFRVELEKTTEYVAKHFHDGIFKLLPIVGSVAGYGKRPLEVTFLKMEAYFFLSMLQISKGWHFVLPYSESGNRARYQEDT